MKRWLRLNKFITFWLIAGSAAAVTTAAALRLDRKETALEVRPSVAWRVPDSTVAELGQAFAAAEPWTKTPNGLVAAGIIPHHGLVGSIMAGWVSSLSLQPAPETVVIVGPDHKNAGHGYMTSTLVDWQTPDGIAQVDRELVQGLFDEGLVVNDSELIQAEHGVYTAIPYIHRAWPLATVVTIAIKGDARPDRIAKLAEELDRALGVNDLVVATVDFSHYTTAIDALRADEESLEVIRRGDVDAALRLPVDSPPAISLILEYAKRRSLTYQQIAHTTSAQFTGQLDAQSTTSYLSAYFTAAR